MNRLTYSTFLAVATACASLGVPAPAARGADEPDKTERREPSAVPILEFRILADPEHDRKAVEAARTPDGLKNPPPGYRWVRVHDGSTLAPSEGVVIREEEPAGKASSRFLLVKLDAQNVNEKDVALVRTQRDERDKPAVAVQFTREGGERFGRLTREHLPERGGEFKYRLAIVVNGEARSALTINSEVRESALVTGLDAEEVSRAADDLNRSVGGSGKNAEAREWFEDAKFGLFVHWGVYSLLGKGEWVMDADKIPIAEYEKLPTRFNPTKFDAEEWVKTAKGAGMKYITITSKHHDGFCMFDSKLTTYDVVDGAPYGKDPMKALADACHKHGIKLFFYYSLLDWHHPDYFPRGRTGKSAGREEKGDWKRYVAYYQGQVRELCTNYGEIGGLWFDGWWDRPDAEWDMQGTYRIIHELQPGALVGNNHHVKPLAGEDFQMFEQDLPGENKAGFNKAETTSTLPLETCLTMNNSWGYNAADKAFKTPEQVVHYLLGASGRGANLLLNVGPRPDGAIGSEFTERLAEVGKWLRSNGETVYGTRRGPITPQPWGVSVKKGRTVYLHVLKPEAKLEFDSAIPFDEAELFGGKKADGFGVSTSKAAIKENGRTTETAHTRIDLPSAARSPIDTIIVLKRKD